MTQQASADDLREILSLVEGSDSVEMKLTVPDNDIRSVGLSLGLDPIESQIRQVVFFDTPGLELNAAGVVVRARRIQGGTGDTVIKLRPVVPAEVPETLRHSVGVGIEVDVMPGGHVCSASLKGKTKASHVLDVLYGRSGIKDLFSKDQKSFYKKYAPEGIHLSDLSILGPITILKLKFDAAEIGRDMVAEMWLYPDGSRVLELSTKCLPADIVKASGETRAYLERNNVDLEGEQQTKTKTALEYFASLLTDDADV
jgi:hypothetical protein